MSQIGQWTFSMLFDEVQTAMRPQTKMAIWYFCSSRPSLQPEAHQQRLSPESRTQEPDSVLLSRTHLTKPITDARRTNMSPTSSRIPTPPSSSARYSPTMGSRLPDSGPHRPSSARTPTPSGVPLTPPGTEGSSQSYRPPRKSYKSEARQPHTKETEQPSPNKSSPYVSAHLGDPCTIGSLDHLLTCGHKILTMQPEDCTSNCKQSTSPLINPRGLDEPFCCMACITEHIRDSHAQKVAAFCEELKRVAKETGKRDAKAWIAEKIAIMEIGWHNQRVEEMDAKAEKGRFCHAFYVDPEYQELAELALHRKEKASRKRAPMNQHVAPAQRGATQSRHGQSPGLSTSSASASASRSSTTKKSPSRIPSLQKCVSGWEGP
ncbi:hypothetical protein LTR37_000434 [Vermiconidia calcicola]|uniref:Uncharacterized protein n=1 Tax=Vermiconidia calcicola TaxID=1690605 RepID=A0ACC3P0D0_9PEZI|nr:hypothetical protein LTR37_000434 [Vermiconidia calcicola]